MPASKRPNFSVLLRKIIKDIHVRVPEFKHMRSEKILITSGQARKRSRATMRPYAFSETGTRRSENGLLYKPIVTFEERRIRYEITLRPLFFMRSTAQERLQTLFHELFHMSQTFDGTLDRERRHDRLPRTEFAKHLRPLLLRYQKQMPDWVMQALSHEGEVMMLQWLERPPSRYRPSQTVKRRYTERDLFLGPVFMQPRAKPSAKTGAKLSAKTKPPGRKGRKG